MINRRRFWLLLVAIIYLTLSLYQLGLPGLHYDEAREAGVNAMEILTGAPITAFRNAGVTLGGRTFPLMVQDYIGALNVYLALPFLALTGIGAPNLRILPVLCGLLALLLVERSVSEWIAGMSSRQSPERDESTAPVAPLSFSGLLAISLLAVSPSFIFWSRQGIFVTNLTQVFVFLCIWQTVRWLRTGKPRALVVAALAAGLALYAKLLAIWVIAPLALFVAFAWLLARRRQPADAPRLAPATLLLAVLAFGLPLLPVIWFNVQSSGTLVSIGGNLEQSYYGVNNLAVGANLSVRLNQLVQVVRGDQFWYLGASFANQLAPWLAAVALVVGAARAPRVVAPPLLLLSAAVLASVFTVSDLFVTHYALLQPLMLGTVGVAMGAIFQETTDGVTAAVVHSGGSYRRRAVPRLGVSHLLVGAFFLTWIATDLINTVAYHRALTQSGGLAAHSDASYDLAYHLRYNGMGAPLALDWGIDASVRYLSEGTVTPIEIFGYASPQAPDEEFAQQIAPFLDNPDNTYLLHSKDMTVFQGRAETFFAMVSARELTPLLEQEIFQRDGTPVYEIWKVYK
ncbi:glycosyltransferase family 39 protein [Caldilinea sp.]|uniref:glycosyltransferase family 39 protein n=1 Tax=Caldilinea sp. TaxID=2293560 RepID=UPI002B8A1F5E|nr:glycosyltransferase family 39 protein [Caldilinea sp.]